MRRTVAFDVTSAVTQRAGVGRYTRELFDALVTLSDAEVEIEVGKQFELRPFYVAPGATYPLAGAGGPAPVQVDRSIRAWRLEMLARHALRRPAPGPWDGASLYHAPDVVYPPVHGMPVVMTVHDLSYLVYPRYHTRLNGGYLRLMTPAVTRDARLIMTDSEATRRDLIGRVGVPEDKIRVVYPGVGDLFRRSPTPEEIAAARRRYDLPDAFILSVGTLEPRKNLAGALRAYRLLRARCPDAPPLLLVGGAGWGLDEARLVGVGEGASVRRLGFVPDEGLRALYAACSVFVYPSLYEGFGLPVAEALSLGAPTVTSRVSSLPEVAGDAALLVDPHDVEDIATALTRVLEDTALAARLRATGPARAAQFTYEACARGTRDVYAEALEG